MELRSRRRLLLTSFGTALGLALVALSPVSHGQSTFSPPYTQKPPSENEVASILGSGRRELLCMMPTIRNKSVSMALDQAVRNGAVVYLLITKSNSQYQNPFVMRLLTSGRARITWSQNIPTGICTVDGNSMVVSRYLTGTAQNGEQAIVNQPAIVSALAARLAIIKTRGEVMPAVRR